ncbi:hypothetical protein EV182_001505 [Spiromyces aspiralis]|uniref:Uncharacterized protein n=1 Tax=Spiromyces aspiralis TaxID=68401 RepID=A0ACC1HTS1_9FUNG|nr:hypothetical protein EV182_001505 [Spiromyces aspiralis]
MRHYNIVICNYCRRGDIDRALEMYRRIPSTLNPDVVTYSALFSMYIQVGKRALKGARFGSGSGETTRLGRLASVAVTPRLHKALLDEADHPRHILNDALSSANKFPHSVYNAMIGGLAVFHDFASAQRAYDHMTQVAGLDPDDRTYAALIYTFLRRADVDSAQRVFETIEDNGIVPNLVVCNALVHGFARAGYIKQAFEVYRYMVGFMPCPSFSDESGFSEVAVEEQCQADGEAVLPKFEIKVKPDNFTYFALIKALLYEKRPEDALALYDEMFEVQVVPDTITSAMLADGLEWCGKPEAADRVLMYRNIRINRLLREMKDSVCSEEH